MTTFSKAAYQRWLGITLRTLRGERTLQAAADVLGCSAARVRHFESGRNLPQTRDLQTLLEFYRAAERIPELTELATQIREAAPEQDLSKLASTPSGFDTYLTFEQGVQRLTEWTVMTVPGLLQTWDYARAAMATSERGMSKSEVTRRVEQRLRRQEMLERDPERDGDKPPPEVAAFLDQSVLHREVGGRQVLRDQLAHLERVSYLPNVSVRLLTWDRIASRALNGPFIHLDFGIRGDDGLVYLEDSTGGRTVEDPDHLDDYLMIVDELSAAALTEDESREVIAEIGGRL